MAMDGCVCVVKDASTFCHAFNEVCRGKRALNMIADVCFNGHGWGMRCGRNLT